MATVTTIFGTVGQVKVTGITATTITISYPRIVGAVKYEVMIRFSNDYSGDSLVVFETSNLSYTFKDLTPGATYIMNYRGVNGKESSATGISDEATTSKLNRPRSWTGWDNIEKGNAFNIEATQWINFCKRINEFRVYSGKPLYDFTTDPKYISKGKPFYAWIFQQAALAISEIEIPSLGRVAKECKEVKSNGTIYAWYFANLSAALNYIP